MMTLLNGCYSVYMLLCGREVFQHVFRAMRRALVATFAFRVRVGVSEHCHLVRLSQPRS